MLLYIIITVFANLLSLLIFREHLSITYLSIVPVILAALMAFQAFYFKSEKIENGFHTTFLSNMSTEEENEVQESASDFLIITLPFVIPFIFFFASPLKLLSIALYFIGFMGGPLIYRLKNADKIQSRLNAEEKELLEQQKKEEMGNWK